MADLEQLSISIESDSHKAEEAINSLIRGLENLNNALGSLDVSKISSFTSAVSKLSNIGNNTNTTAKALKTMANDISSLYGVKSKKGVQEITQAVQELYKAQGEALKQNSREADNNYADKYGNLEKAIKDNYQYRQELDDTTKKVVDFIATQKELGTKIGFAGFKGNYNPEQFKALNKAFSGMLDPKHFGYEEGFTQLENFLDLLSSKTGAQISDNSFGGLEDIKAIVDDAKNSVWNFAKAFSEGEHSARGLDEVLSDVAGKIYDIVNAQSQNTGRTGLEGVADFFQTIQMVKIPDLSGMTQAIKDIGANPPKETARAVEDIEKSSEKASKYLNEMYQSVGRIGTTKEMPLALPQWDKMLPAVIKDGREYMAKAHKKLFDSDMKRTWETIDFTPKVEPVLALPQFDKMLPAVVQAQDATRGLFQSIEEVVNEQPKVDAVTSSFNEWKSSLLEAARAAEKTGAQFEKWSVPEQGMNPSFNREALGFVSDIKPNAGEDYFYKIQESAQKCLPAIREVGTTALALPDQFKSFEQATKQAFDSIKSSAKNTVESFSDFHFPDLGTGLPEETFKGVEQGARQASSAIKQAFEDMRRFKEILSNMESGKMPFFEDMYIKYTKGYDEATKKVDDFKKSISGGGEKPTAMADVLENVVELGNALGELSEKFGGIADKGIGLFKMLTKPLQAAVNEYVEKFERMGETVANFQRKFKAHMTKVQQFWKRAMKTFTFMLVRKAITAFIREVNNAIQSMAKFSEAMGTQFNNSISLLVADFQYLGRSIVSVFAPLLNFLAPIIDAIVDKIALLLSYIGMLLAALTGASSFTKAKKNVGNYAKSLDGASKSAKNLTMGIDELNILAENSGGGSAKPYDGWEDAWEEVEIPDWIKDLANKIKKMFEDFLAPLKKAWDAVKEYFKFAFQYMKDQLKQLAKSVWDAFIQVWNEDASVEMFKNILRIIADLMIVIGNLAKNFRESWDEVVNGASRGVQIFRGIRDIFAILVEHARNVTWYMVRWSSELSFDNLLDGVIELLGALYKVADFLGGVFEDVMKNVVLEYIRFMVEEGLPHLMHMISDVVDSFDLEKFRSQLQPLEESFVGLMERIDIGMTNAFGNIGKSIGEFTQSEDFQAFLDNIQYLMDSISDEDVQKVLEGIGLGITHIAEALMKFVGSDSFKDFVDMLNSWLDGKSADDIAGIIEKLAWAIGLFKFAEFATSGAAGFFKFATILVGLKNLHEIAAGMSATAGASTAASSGFAAFASSAAVVVAIIAAVVAAVYSLISSFGGLGGLIARVKEAFDRVKETFRLVAEALNMDEHINKLKEHFQGLMDKLANMQDFWNILLYLVEALAHVFAVVLAPALDIVVTAFDIVIQVISGVIDIIGGLASAIMGLIEGITTGNWDKLKESFSRMGEGIAEAVVFPLGTLFENVNDAVYGAVKGVGSLFSGEVETEIKSADWEKIPENAQVGQKIANGTATSYKNAAANTESVMQETTKGLFNSGLNVAGEVDYKTPATATTQHLMEELYSSAQGSDWATYGTLVNTEAGNSIVNQSQPFTDANATTAMEGAETFGSEYANYFSTNTEMSSALGEFGRTSGLELSNGFNESLEANISVTQSSLTGWFMKVQAIVSEQMSQVRTLFNKLLSNMFSGVDIVAPLNTLFGNVTTAITNNVNTLGANLTGTILPTFMQTYLLPFFGLERWQPLFDNLMNTVFIPLFEIFRTWFTEEAMTVWWNEDLLFWFSADKWNEDIFTPLHELFQENWDTFSGWWDTSMTAWWENQVKVWFSEEIWEEQFNHVLTVAEKVFELIKDAIKKRIEEAQEAVKDACEEMKNAIEEVMTAIDELIEKVGSLGGISGGLSIGFSGGFANGGFPTEGSLFLAGEAGAEFVTNVGGRTGVVSNGEITGIADAVYSTGNQESTLLSELISVGRQMLDKDPVVIGDKDIARMANSGQSKLGMSIIS